MVRSKTLAAILISLTLVFGLPPGAYGSSSSTTTTLSVSSSSVAAGTAVTLTATVTAQSSPVTKGQVTFCDATAAQCDGAAVFGIAQVTSGGTAAITRVLGAGTYTIQAVFSGFLGTGGSTSAPQVIAVTGAANYGSGTAIAASGGVGNYTLTATVTAFGGQTATGTISFLDTSYSDNAVASAALDAASLATVFNPASGSPLPANSAQFVVSADFNGDGIPDLAVVNLAVKGTVSVFLGIGDGTFQPPVNYSAGVNPQMLAVADVNGDGALDLIVVDECTDNGCDNGAVNILLGVGDGTFQKPISFAVGCTPTFVAVGDFNRDGWPDLAIANSQQPTVSILLGTGDVSLFQPQVTYTVGSHPVGIAIGDFNQDTLLDLAVSNSSGGTVSILLGNGDGTFRSQRIVRLPAAVAPYWLVSADLRNIGMSDLVVPDSGASNNVYVLLGNGDGSFQPAVAYAVDAGPYGVSVGDIDGDGILDLVVPNTATNEGAPVSVLLGDGNGGFAAKTDYPVGSNPTFVALADFNGDGLLDIATSNSGSSDATVLLQAHTETATATAVAVYPAGIHNVLASYPGDVDRASSRSTTVALMGSSPATTSTALTTSPNPATVLQTVLLTATVSPAPTGSVLGTVSFYNGATLLGGVNLNSSGVATFSTMNLPVGVDSLTAVYSGNTAFASSTSIPVLETITALTSTTTTLAASPNPAAALQTVLLTATVTPAPTGSALGTVSFYNGATLLGGANLNSSGVATFSTTSLPVGVDSLTAVYSGNTAFATSTSNPFSETITALTSNTTTLAASPNPAAALQTVLLTATVTPVPTGSALGTVSFYNGATLLGSANLNSSGVATLSTSNLPVGVDSLTAVYSGNTAFASSTSIPVLETITALTNTTTVLAASPNPAPALQTVTLTATITPAPTGSALGTMSFYNGATLLGSVNLNSSGVATFSTTSLPVGVDSLTAAYSGNTAFAASTSIPVMETIIALTNTTTALAASPNPAAPLQTVTLTATVTPAPTGAVLGTVSFYNGASLLSSVNLNSAGVAAFSTTSLPVGVDSLTAVYSGNATFATSTSNPFSETISIPSLVEPTFMVMARQTSVTAPAGGSATINASVLPNGGAFNDVVTMSATGLPPGATASFNPPTVIPGGAGAPTVLTAQLAPVAAGIYPQQGIPLASFAMTLGLCGMGVTRKRFSRRVRRTLAFVALSCVAFTLVGCGNGGFLRQSNPQPGSYVVTITGTSGLLQSSAVVTVVVP